MADEQNQQETNQGLDDRTDKVLRFVAYWIGSFQQQNRTGRLTFQIDFEQGRVPEQGFRHILDEQVE